MSSSRRGPKTRPHAVPWWVALPDEYAGLGIFQQGNRTEWQCGHWQKQPHAAQQACGDGLGQYYSNRLLCMMGKDTAAPQRCCTPALQAACQTESAPHCRCLHFRLHMLCQHLPWCDSCTVAFNVVTTQQALRSCQRQQQQNPVWWSHATAMSSFAAAACSLIVSSAFTLLTQVLAAACKDANTTTEDRAQVSRFW